MPSLADLSPAASPRSGCCCWYKELPGGGLWGLSIVQGPFSVAPRQTATLRFATFQPPVGGRRTRSGCTRRSRRCARHGPPTAPGTASRTHTGTSTSYACTCNQAHQGPPLKSNRGFNRVLNTPIGARRRAHPWFFSMGRLHLGHGLELARIQFMFSLSALFFITHLVAQKCPVSVPPPPNPRWHWPKFSGAAGSARARRECGSVRRGRLVSLFRCGRRAAALGLEPRGRGVLNA
jgi:hypothetical protein